ncbi:MAG: monooxygenase [Calditrichaeota bacterium]|nr:MAG: monooxygenase [Calditrichota bacterium]
MGHRRERAFDVESETDVFGSGERTSFVTRTGGEVNILDRTDRYCVIGAGSSGLVAAKNLKQHGIPCDVLEREDEVGGIWNYGKPFSSVYRSTHLISSKPLTEYTDFPMPADYPDYPNHAQVLAYFKAYARHFGLYDLIEFNTTVERVAPSGAGWEVTLAGGHKRRYRGVVIANGHLWNPHYPDFPGKFDGTALHSRDYKTPDVLRDKRVLVVGAGNSGCDIAVEAAQNAARTFHSVRRGYHYIPKYLFGKPADQVGEVALRLRVPLFLRRWTNGLILRLFHGRPQDFGLPKPDHKLFESHPIVNSQIFYYLGHGDIIPKPDVEELRDDRVRFRDGSEEPIDVIVYATGYEITFPFIDSTHLNWRNGHPALFLNVFHPEYDNLFVAGLIQPDSGQWGLVDYQTQLIARFVRAQEQNPASAERFRRLKAGTKMDLGHGIRYLPSSRHAIEVEHFSYRRRLQKLIRRFD